MENEKLNIFERISLWWRMDARYYHRDFANGIKNLIRWFPTIWRDRDWDDHYIWNIMAQKLKFQAKYIGDRDYHTSAKRDAEIMMTCVELMERIKSEYYGMEFMDYQDSTFEFVDSDIPGNKELKITENSEQYDEFFKKYPLAYKRIVKKFPNKDKKYIALELSIDNHKRAKRILFKMMENNIEKWWD